MANFDTSEMRDPAVAFPTSGVHLVRGRYVNGSTAITTSDKLRLTYLPKGAAIVPELCKFFSDDVDPDSGANLTLAMKVTDGTTTKTIITAVAFQAINVLAPALAPAVTALNFFKTSNDDFYVYLEPGAGDLDASAEVFWQVGYTMDTGRAETTT